MSHHPIIEWEFLLGTQSGPWEVWREKFGSIPDHKLPWQLVRVPHCYTAGSDVDPDGPYYQGDAWYRTLVEPPEVDLSREDLILDFGGVGQNCEVFIGWQSVGSHRGAYDGFCLDVTSAVRSWRDQNPGGDLRIPLSVRTDNRRDANSIPSDLSDFVLHGGLHRKVSWRVEARFRAGQIHWMPTIDGEGVASLQLAGRFQGPRAQGVIRAILSDAGGAVMASLEEKISEKGERFVLDLGSVPNVKAWSPAHPVLYHAQVVIESDFGCWEENCRLGFRRFDFEPHGPFWLNGEVLALRGTHRHEDHAGCGSAVPPEITRRELEMMKAMGVNFIRLGHYPQDDFVLDLCDELGFLVWEEIPWCRGGLGGVEHREHTRACLEAMVVRHRNHPSIILWGLGNENDWPGDFPVFDEEDIRRHLCSLHTLAHELDPARRTTIRRCEFARDAVDVYSPSIWAGWYRGSYTDYRAAVLSELTRSPFIFHAEWGADHHAGRYAEDATQGLPVLSSNGTADERAGDYLLTGGEARVSRDGDWSETYACDLIDWHLHEQASLPQLTGSAYWLFKDFATPLRPQNPIPYVNQKGVVDRALEPKESFYVFQSWWAAEPMVHIHGHAWKDRWLEPGKPTRLRVYSNCPEVILFLNGREVGSRLRDPGQFPCAGLYWDLELECGEYEVRAIGKDKAREVEDNVRFRLNPCPGGNPHRIILSQSCGKDGTILVHARLLDAENRPCLKSRAWMEFQVAGDATLLDNLGTPQGSRRIQAANGAAAIGVQLTSGLAHCYARSPGCPTTFLPLQHPPSS